MLFRSWVFQAELEMMRLLIVEKKRIALDFHERLDLTTFLLARMHDPMHARRLRMKYESFVRLVNLIREPLQVDQLHADRRGGAITPEACVYATLRYLSGATYVCICDLLGIGRSSFYSTRDKTLLAIINCDALQLQFPSTVEQCVKLASGFEDISYRGAIVNCVGAVDGFILPIQTPSAKVVGNVKAYFSGHYKRMSINIQAVCDCHCRFLYFQMCAPGSTGDAVAFKVCDENGGSLFDAIEALPGLYVMIADTAYPPTEHCVPLYGHPDTNNQTCSNFNFFGSQLRMRVEMSFGIMSAKWGLLRMALYNKLDRVKMIILAIARLHNFVIDERLASGDGWDPVAEYPDLVAAAMEMDEHEPIPGHSAIRDSMTDRVRTMGLTRPGRNTQQNNQE
jgi:DDE superfamily endonuclease